MVATAPHLSSCGYFFLVAMAEHLRGQVETLGPPARCPFSLLFWGRVPLLNLDLPEEKTGTNLFQPLKSGGPSFSSTAYVRLPLGCRVLASPTFRFVVRRIRFARSSSWRSSSARQAPSKQRPEQRRGLQIPGVQPPRFGLPQAPPFFVGFGADGSWILVCLALKKREKWPPRQPMIVLSASQSGFGPFCYWFQTKNRKR